MSFEEDIAKLNEFYFFREFTFSENTFRKSPTEEVELADNMFKTRFKLSMDKAKINQFTLPYRIALPRTNCGFVFIPLTSDFLERRQQFLQNLTYAHKYDQKLPKCIGVSFDLEEDGWYSVEWCYMESQWKYDQEMDNMLKKNNPFREVQVAELPQYMFGADE